MRSKKDKLGYFAPEVLFGNMKAGYLDYLVNWGAIAVDYLVGKKVKGFDSYIQDKDLFDSDQMRKASGYLSKWSSTIWQDSRAKKEIQTLIGLGDSYQQYCDSFKHFINSLDSFTRRSDLTGDIVNEANTIINSDVFDLLRTLLSGKTSFDDFMDMYKTNSGEIESWAFDAYDFVTKYGVK